MVTTSAIRSRIESQRRWLGVLEDGLNGKPHILSEGEADYLKKFALTWGLELISQSVAVKRGLVLKRGAKPICSRRYARPINPYSHLYLLEQFKKKK